ncbi:hypothetical protein TVAG_116790 [Trichomonas vaginalis G3]|uniref:DUF7777 domain-containing protein n=1 Tax=Trichomonas vaginalis (strain ATCC PRA-98 / G3) TaxID=412133 RepID=A2FD54_TRIV3|nr:hypothetical protein TVAG_116790 [Trichomonas vaginalis G3]|eukprot:XP_001310091.1 hypothetical protein [Trichomonas vaginalis G3]
MLPIEKENSRVATTKPLDELFTNVGQKFETDTVKHEGYRFDYPLRWLRDPSVTKAIGFRRMKFISEAIHGFPFTVGFEVRYYNKEKRMYEKFEQGKLLQVSLLINLEITLQAFQEKINDIYIEYANQYNIDEGEYHLDIIYDRKNATVKINKIEDLGENVYISTKYNNLAWYRFMRMLNQLQHIQYTRTIMKSKTLMEHMKIFSTKMLLLFMLHFLAPKTLSYAWQMTFTKNLQSYTNHQVEVFQTFKYGLLQMEEKE